MARNSRKDNQDVLSEDDEYTSQDWIEYLADSQVDDKNESFRQHCHYCGKEFFTARKRLSHERFCKSGSIERFSCTECGLNFQLQQCLRKHEKRHEEPGGFPCCSCDARFTSFTDRLQHRNAEHRLFRCQICLVRCTSSADYVTHIMTSHSDCKCGVKASTAKEKKSPKRKSKLSCEKCGVKFRNRTNLENHVQSLACEKPYKCAECGKSFSFQVSLITHAAQHGGMHPSACDRCGQNFTGYDQLIQHRRANPYTCGLPQEKKRNTRNSGKVKKITEKEDLGQKIEDFDAGDEEEKPQIELFNGVVKQEPSPETILFQNLEDVDLDDDVPLSQLKSQAGVTQSPEVNMKTEEPSNRQLRKKSRENKVYSEDSADGMDLFDFSGPPESPPSCFTTDSDSEYEEKRKKTASSGGQPEASRFPDYKCTICPKVYCYQRKLVIHLRSEHNIDSDDDNWPLERPSKTNYTPRERKHECKYCKRVYANQSSLARHVKCHGPNGELLFRCKTCKGYFDTEENLKEHRDTYHKDKIMCNICNKSYAGEHNLKTHIELRHTKTKTIKKMSYLCGKCGKNFTSKTALLDHERSDCGKKPIYQCDVCKKFYHSAGSLKGHKTLHTKVRPFLCKYCGKPYRTPGQMREHERVHTGERPHKCTYCPKAFSHRGSLLTHLSLHTGFKRFMCSGCGQRFTCISNLQAHRKSHADTCGLVPNCTKAIGRMEAYILPQKEDDMDHK